MLLELVFFASLSFVTTDAVKCEEPGQWRCDDGRCVTAAVCDGQLQCLDGSDESLARCHGTQRPLLELILFCAQPGLGSQAVCPEACRRWPEYCYYAIAAENGVPGTCQLPPYPIGGDYSIEAIEPYRVGTSTGLADFTLLYTCQPGFSLYGSHPRCVSGTWTGDFPSCHEGRKCQLKKRPSVDYECIDILDSRCPEWVDSGQRVLALCQPGFVQDAAPLMRCMDGIWYNFVSCRPDCGIMDLDSEGISRSGVPWHASVYNKLKTPYQQICGGSLVSTTIVISAAHCFWTEGLGIASTENYAVGIGKIYYRPWNKKDDGQKFDVSDIKVPPFFDGANTNYQDDISIVVLATSVVVTVHVNPVCLDFGVQLDEFQLRPGNVGKVAGWSLKPVLQVMNVFPLDITQCFTELPADFASFITSDKICASSGNGSAICRGDSGGGLVFPATDSGGRVRRWYLRGVVSTAPRTDQMCSGEYTAFTQLVRHQTFIGTFWS